MTRRVLRGVTILIVEDHQDTREAIAAALTAAGARALTAPSAQVGLRLVEQERPNVIVSDLEMREVDGWAFLRAVRALPPEKGGRTPAMALSAHNRPEDRARSLRAGFVLHLAKPCDPTELADLLAAVVRQ